MKVYIVVETFKGGKIPEIRGAFIDKAKAEEIKDAYRFAFINEQNLIQTKEENEQQDVYIIMELMVLNVPRISGVFKNKSLAEDMAEGCDYEAKIIKETLI